MNVQNKSSNTLVMDRDAVWAQLRDEAVRSVLEAASDQGYALSQRADSRLEGPSGNREIFALLRPDQ